MKVLCVTLMEKSRGYIRSSFPWVLRVRRFVVIEGPSKITPLTINVNEETQSSLMKTAIYISPLSVTEDHVCDHETAYTLFKKIEDRQKVTICK